MKTALFFACSVSCATVMFGEGANFYVKQGTWWDSMRASRETYLQSHPATDPNIDGTERDQWRKMWTSLAADFPSSTAEGLSASVEAATTFGLPRDGLELHIARQGNDASDGSAERPLATLEGARDRIRALRRAGQATHGIVVTVHQGTYYRAATFRLSVEDSGTPECPFSIVLRRERRWS